jgi:VanZ family protein
MAVIFSASADTQSYQHSSRFFLPLLHWLFPRMSAEHVDTCHYLFRKCGHLTEYAVLGLLLWRAIRQPRKNRPQPWRWSQAGLAVSLVLLYSASDEIHQAFVPTRTAHATDVLIDTSGAAIGLLLLWLTGKIFKRW